MPRSSRGLKLLKPKLGCREAVFHLFVKQMPPIDHEIKVIQIGTISIFLSQH
jgi:hypothetical protein